MDRHGEREYMLRFERSPVLLPLGKQDLARTYLRGCIASGRWFRIPVTLRFN